jgi:hypothetical protein
VGAAFACCLGWAGEFTEVVLVPGSEANDAEGRILALLADRIAAHGAVSVRTGGGQADVAAQDGRLRILIGVPARHPLLATLCAETRLPEPTERDPGPEGFALRTLPSEAGAGLLAAAVDTRGMLYAVGEILRRMEWREAAVVFPYDLDMKTAPAFPIRGTEVGQGDTMRKLTGARTWTEEEWRNAVLDYALAGANTFGVGHTSPAGGDRYDFIRSYGLDTLTSLSPNGGSGPPEWEALEAIGRKGHLCPSIPEAREALLRSCEERFKNSPSYDYVRMYSGDGGGCECERCAPYGKTYIEMCEAMAAIIHRYHPQTKIFATNQKLDNAGDQAIFDYLNAAPRPWLTALCYGPGSNAMSWQPGRRQDHRMDLWRYPAFGEYDRYLQEILHQLPPTQSLVFFTDVTHWVYSEYGLVNYAPIPDRNNDTPPYWSKAIYSKGADPALAMVYDRRTFHARPRHFHRVFQETMRYGIGDVTYSEGHHDHFNQWMWQRLLWAPHAPVEEVVTEYARTWFGPEAVSLMAEAIFQLEENLSAPLAENEGIDRMCRLVREAGDKMPEHVKRNNSLWREYLQKALLDKYVQLRLRQQLDAEKPVLEVLSKGLQSNDCDAAIARAQALLNSMTDTDEMKALREEAGRLGEESNMLAGVRNDGYFNLDQDFIGLAWLRKQVEAAANTTGEDRRAALRRVADYEDAEAGALYDDLGNPGRCPHLVYGWTFTEGELSGANRPSQCTMAFTAEDPQGVTLLYEDLDETAPYRIRFALVRPPYEPRYASRQTQKTESIYADGSCLAKDLELPVNECGLFEFDIPRSLTEDGELRVWFEKSAGVGEGPWPQVEVWRNTGGWGTLCSDVWLIKVGKGASE